MEYTIIKTVNNMSAREKHYDVRLRRIKSVHFLSKQGKGASYDGRDGWKGCLFIARVGVFEFDVIMYKVLFPILYIDLAWKHFFPARKWYK